MPSVNIQFHMLFNELIAFVRDVSSQYRLEVELERFYPKAVREVPFGADLAEEVCQFGQIDRFWLMYKSPESQKPERFMLNVGQQRGNRLAQAQLGAGTRKAKAYEVLKQVATDLQHRTMAGIWVITASGNAGYSKKFRFSEGAANAARAGDIELVGIAFTQSFRVDPPETQTRQPNLSTHPPTAPKRQRRSRQG
jgi:hypothetical protein